MFGFEPDSFGRVEILSTALDDMGLSKDFKLNRTKAFLTGKSPAETNPLSPSKVILDLKAFTYRLGLGNIFPLVNFYFSSSFTSIALILKS